MPPGEDLRRSSSAKQGVSLRLDRLDGVEQPPVAQQNAHRQMPPRQRAKILVNLVTVDLVDHVGDQDHQRSLAAVRCEVEEGLIVARLDELRKAVERGVQQ